MGPKSYTNSVLPRGEEMQAQTHEGRVYMMTAEARVLQLLSRATLRVTGPHQMLGKGKEGFPSTGLRGAQPC